MKKFLIIASIVLPLGFLLGLFLWAQSIWTKVKITPYFVSADFKGLNLQDVRAILASGEEREIDAVLGMEIRNDSNSAITFSGLKAKLSHNGVLIAETSEELANQKFTAKANEVLQVTDSVKVKLNQAGAQLLLNKLAAQKSKIDYTLEFSVYGIPILRWFPIKNSFTW